MIGVIKQTDKVTGEVKEVNVKFGKNLTDIPVPTRPVYMGGPKMRCRQSNAMAPSARGGRGGRGGPMLGSALKSRAMPEQNKMMKKCAAPSSTTSRSSLMKDSDRAERRGAAMPTKSSKGMMPYSNSIEVSSLAASSSMSTTNLRTSKFAECEEESEMFDMSAAPLMEKSAIKKKSKKSESKQVSNSMAMQMPSAVMRPQTGVERERR